ncbi:MAG: ATP-grasp domain-containing protein, partial [Gaiellaceae bacterium]
GCRVLNRADALLAVHDKLLTARLLEEAEIVQPRSAHVVAPRDELPLEPPVVVKPRFGSWGRDVFLCRTRADFAKCLDALASRPWFRSGGALVQELIPPRHFDLRLLVAGGRVVGSAQRVAAHGDWRTNVSLGGRLLPMIADPAARALGARAADAVGADLVAIDLLPSARGWIVLELNGAADFDATYSWPGRDVFADVARALGLLGRRHDTRVLVRPRSRTRIPLRQNVSRGGRWRR